jgi:hypothetical protein
MKRMQIRKESMGQRNKEHSRYTTCRRRCSNTACLGNCQHGTHPIIVISIETVDWAGSSKRLLVATDGSALASFGGRGDGGACFPC